jgi:hypothetical protein
VPCALELSCTCALEADQDTNQRNGRREPDLQTGQRRPRSIEFLVPSTESLFVWKKCVGEGAFIGGRSRRWQMDRMRSLPKEPVAWS